MDRQQYCLGWCCYQSLGRLLSSASTDGNQVLKSSMCTPSQTCDQSGREQACMDDNKQFTSHISARYMHASATGRWPYMQALRSVKSKATPNQCTTLLDMSLDALREHPQYFSMRLHCVAVLELRLSYDRLCMSWSYMCHVTCSGLIVSRLLSACMKHRLLLLVEPPQAANDSHSTAVHSVCWQDNTDRGSATPGHF